MLARPANEITLRDVYRAVECEERLFSLHHERPSAKCPVGRNIERVLVRATGAAQTALEEQLATRTVADVMEEIQAEDRESRTVSI